MRVHDFITLSVTIASFLIGEIVRAERIHHGLRHNHVHERRQLFSTAASPLPSSSADQVAEDAVSQDVAEIEQGLSALPGDLLAFLVSVQNQLQQAESLLSSLIGQSTQSVLPPGTAVSTSFSTLSTIVSTPTVSSYGISSSLSASSGSTLRTSALKTPSHTTATSSTSGRRTITETLKRTSTVYDYTTISNTLSSTSYSTPSIQIIPITNTTIMPSATNASHTIYATITTTSSTAAQATPTSNSSYVFNASATSNLAVYYGQSPDTSLGDLVAICETSSVDIVILSFVTTLSSSPGSFSMPSASFGPGCTVSTPAQELDAPGLQNCTALAPEITACQDLGKKVLVSLGGYTGKVSLPSSAAATQAALDLWDLFGGGSVYDWTLRPFGNVTIDGFDLDNETGDSSYYDVFATALRSAFANDKSKDYYISAAPQCPYPDASISLSALAQTDFVWVQFYNNPSCNLDSDGFQQSFATWSAELAGVSNRTRLYVGAAAFEGAGSGYVTGDGLEAIVGLARHQETANLGGIMLWDGSEGLSNTDSTGKNYLGYAKLSVE